MPLDLEKDRFLAQEIDDALSPVRDVLPPDAVDELEQAMGEVLTHYPIMAELMNQLRPNPIGVQQSDDVEAGTLERGVVRPGDRSDAKKKSQR